MRVAHGSRYDLLYCAAMIETNQGPGSKTGPLTLSRGWRDGTVRWCPRCVYDHKKSLEESAGSFESRWNWEKLRKRTHEPEIELAKLTIVPQKIYPSNTRRKILPKKSKWIYCVSGKIASIEKLKINCDIIRCDLNYNLIGNKPFSSWN